MKDNSGLDQYIQKALSDASKGVAISALRQFTNLDMSLEDFLSAIKQTEDIVKVTSQIKLSELFAGVTQNKGLGTPTTRDNIIDLLRSRPMTKQEVMKELMRRGVYKSKASAYSSVYRHHFKTLDNEGLIEPVTDDTDGAWRTT